MIIIYKEITSTQNSVQFMIINARGTLINIPKDSNLIKMSTVLQTWLSTQMKSNDEEKHYYFNYSPDTVNNLIDILENPSDILINEENFGYLQYKNIIKISDELLIPLELPKHKYIEIYEIVNFLKQIKENHYNIQDIKLDLLEKFYDKLLINKRPIICIIGLEINTENKDYFGDIVVCLINENLNTIQITFNGFSTNLLYNDKYIDNESYQNNNLESYIDKMINEINNSHDNVDYKSIINFKKILSNMEPKLAQNDHMYFTITSCETRNYPIHYDLMYKLMIDNINLQKSFKQFI